MYNVLRVKSHDLFFIRYISFIEKLFLLTFNIVKGLCIIYNLVVERKRNKL